MEWQRGLDPRDLGLAKGAREPVDGRRPVGTMHHHLGQALVAGRAPEHEGFRQTLLDIYVPRYGPEWESFLDSGPVYARIDAERMFALFIGPSSPDPS